MKKVVKPVHDIRKLSDAPLIEFVSTGVPEIDSLVGGWPRGRISEVFGDPATGKSSLMYLCLKSCVGKYKVLYDDVESALNVKRLAELEAVDPNFYYSDAYVLEEVSDMVVDSINDYDLIIIDSVAAMVTVTERDGEMGDANIGIKARLMGQFMRRLTGKLGQTKCAVVFINQWRESPNMFVPRFRPGGKALPYASSLGLELTTKKADRKENGQTVHVTVSKSKISTPFVETEFFLPFSV